MNRTQSPHLTPNTLPARHGELRTAPGSCTNAPGTDRSREQGEAAPRVLLLLVLGLAALVVWGGPLIDPDEGRYASIPRAMVVSGDWVVPRLNGLPYAEKPPLSYWITAVCLRIFGNEVWAVRLAPALVTLATAIVVGRLARKLGGPRGAAIAQLAHGTAALPLALSNCPLPDLPLTLGQALVLAAWTALLREDGDTPPGRADLLGALGLGVGFLSKGPIAVVLAGLPPLLLGRRGLGLIRRAVTLRAVALFLLMVAPWFVAIGLELEGHTRFFFWHEHIERFLGQGGHREHGLGAAAFLGASLLLLVPWGVFLPWGTLAANVAALRRPRAANGPAPGAPELTLWAAAALVPVLVFLPSSSRLLTYLLPGTPALAALVGVGAGSALEAPGGRWRWQALRATTALAGLGILGGAGALGFLAPGSFDLEALWTSWLPVLLSALGVSWIALGARSRQPGRGALLAVGACLFGTALAARRGAALWPLTPTTEPLVHEICARPRTPVISVDRLRQSLEFYVGRAPYQLGAVDELHFGAQFDTSGLLLTDRAQALHLLDATGEILLVADERRVQALPAGPGLRLERLAGGGRYTLYSLHRGSSGEPRVGP